MDDLDPLRLNPSNRLNVKNLFPGSRIRLHVCVGVSGVSTGGDLAVSPACCASLEVSDNNSVS